jgi:sugar lactone lactonase YvrE
MAESAQMPIPVKTAAWTRPHRGRLAACAAVCLLGAAQLRAADDPLLSDVLIDDTNVYPESLSSTRDGTLYIGSMKGIIFRAPAGHTKAEPWIEPGADNGLLTVFGVLADERSQTLWICSSPNPIRVPPAEGTAALMAFDLKSGQQKAVYPFPEPASACNDITIARDGTAYVTDTPNGRILRLAPKAKSLTVWAQDAVRLKGIDGIVLSADQILYVNNVRTGELLRVDRNKDGSPGALTTLSTSMPLGGPDGFRLIHDRTFLLAENMTGRIDEVTISGDNAEIKVLRSGLNSPPGVTLAGRTVYAIEGKIGYLIDAKLRGQDPGPFVVQAIPLPR